MVSLAAKGVGGHWGIREAGIAEVAEAGNLIGEALYLHCCLRPLVDKARLPSIKDVVHMPEK